jgi:rod shape-determining protein MreC
MQGSKVVRRRRAVFAVLVLLSLGLVTATFESSGPVGAIQRGVQAVLSPLEAGASTALKPLRDITGWLGDSIDAQDENDELRAEVESLREQLAAAETKLRDAEQLDALAALSEEEGYPQGTEPVTANVIAQSPTAWFSTVNIDAGTSDGVKEDQPVVAAGGLAGKVTDATGGSAKVTLITDPDSAVSAEVVPRGTGGVLKPQVGNPDDLLLDFLPKDEEVEEGETVVTSGSTSTRLESLFPRGIPIGEISRVDPDERELYQRVHVELFADLQNLQVVQVLTSDNIVEAAGVAP